MMPQMESGDPIREQPGSAYRGYEGQQNPSQPPYGTSYQPPPSGSTLDDNLVEAVAQRIVQILNNQGSSEKIYGQSGRRDRPSSGQRLALAIVSLAFLIPIAGVLFGTLGAIGLIGFCIACLVILLVNIVFNVALR